MNRINLKELSKMLSLNPSTVSRALSDHPDIKPETKKRVIEAATQFNYQPNLHARYFRKKTSGLIAVILPEFNMFFVPGIMKGINAALETSGHSIIIFFSNDSYTKEKEIVNHCLSWKVDGVLISLAQDTKDCDHLQILQNTDIPVILMDKVIDNDTFTSITIDDQKAAFDAVRKLLDQGKSNILGVFGNPEMQMTQDRLKGFKNALADSSVTFTSAFLTMKNKSEIEQLILRSNFDGIFVMSDEILLSIYQIVRKYNLHPEKLQLIAISDGILPLQLFPPIPHIKHSGFDIGKLATETLLKNKSLLLQPTKIRVPTHFVQCVTEG
jgi:LacI family transcriptional regulator